jgi:hypothetical protein
MLVDAVMTSCQRPQIRLPVPLCCKVRENKKKTKTGGGEKLGIFSENRGRPVAFFSGYFLAAGICWAYIER